MHKNTGQSLLEVLIAAGIGVILITSAIVIIAPALKGSTTSTRLQVSTALGQELLENVRGWAESDWNAMNSLATTSAAQYYFSSTSSPFTVAMGTQNVEMATTTFIRYFFLDDVNRESNDPNGVIVTGAGSLDPSTKKVTVVYGFQGASTSSIVTYVTRFSHRTVVQSDWSDPSVFSTSSNIDFSTTTGSILLDL